MTHLKRPWCWERLKAGREGDNRGWDGWMASPTQWTWVWVSSGSWWWTGKPGVLQSMRSQRVRHDWTTELNCANKILADLKTDYKAPTSRILCHKINVHKINSTHLEIILKDWVKKNANGRYVYGFFLMWVLTVDLTQIEFIIFIIWLLKYLFKILTVRIHYL